jgi:electron transfer flavoprotein alpha subunit
MTGVLVIAEHREGRLRDATLEAITAAALLGEVSVAVIAREPAGLTASVAVTGVAEILHVAVAADEFESDVWIAVAQSLIEERQPRYVVAPWSVDAMGYAPAVAARTGLALATDVYAFEKEAGSLLVDRAFYGGKVEARLTLGSTGAFVLVRPGAFAPAPPTEEAAPVTEIDVTATNRSARHREYLQPMSNGDVDITTAKVLLAIGRGVGEKDNIARFEELAEQMGAEMAVSRPLVDAGWVTSARQVGQSGRTVKPSVYLAFGISGAIQHLAGMRESETIVAVNTDPDAAIFGVAEIGAVADIFDVADELEKLFNP